MHDNRRAWMLICVKKNIDTRWTFLMKREVHGAIVRKSHTYAVFKGGLQVLNR